LGSRILAVAAINVIDFLLAILIALASWHLFEKHFVRLKELFRHLMVTVRDRSHYLQRASRASWRGFVRIAVP
jgi:peptidoglycan/LPS O-acetylase OafA/YrhL